MDLQDDRFEKNAMVSSLDALFDWPGGVLQAGDRHDHPRMAVTLSCGHSSPW